MTAAGDRHARERRLLQGAVAVAGCVPVAAGAGGGLLGAGFLGAPPDGLVDSHVRYLSGLLLAIGLAFWQAVPTIERHAARFRLLGAIVVCGGLARLLGVVVTGWPPWTMTLAFVMELIVTPALVLWQARIARQATS
jgi:hypothetical protein